MGWRNDIAGLPCSLNRCAGCLGHLRPTPHRAHSIADFPGRHESRRERAADDCPICSRGRVHQTSRGPTGQRTSARPQSKRFGACHASSAKAACRQCLNHWRRCAQGLSTLCKSTTSPGSARDLGGEFAALESKRVRFRAHALEAFVHGLTPIGPANPFILHAQRTSCGIHRRQDRCANGTSTTDQPRRSIASLLLDLVHQRWLRLGHVGLDGLGDVAFAHPIRELDNAVAWHVNELRHHSILPVAGL